MEEEIQKLQKALENYKNRNRELQLEVKSLRQELARLQNANEAYMIFICGENKDEQPFKKQRFYASKHKFITAKKYNEYDKHQYESSRGFTTVYQTGSHNV